MHEGGGRWVGSNKVVELKKKKKELETFVLASATKASKRRYFLPLHLCEEERWTYQGCQKCMTKKLC